jgi:integrase/recombinase XerD
MKNTLQTPAYQTLINNFDSFIKVRNYKLGKSSMHQTSVIEFLLWMEENGVTKIKEVTSKEVLRYFDFLITRPNQRREGTLSEKTIKSHLYALGLFMQNLLENKAIDNGFYIPSYGNNGTSKSRSTLSVEEIKLVYAHCQNDLESALLSVAYGCGLRRTELERLNLRDIQISHGELIVREGKGSKRRVVPMSNVVIESVKKYIHAERQERLISTNTIEDAFFINLKGKRMTGEYLNDTLKKMIEQTGSYEIAQKEITLHCLRHSIANHLAENNAGIDFIKRFLGHAEINTAYIYAIKNKKRNKITSF